MTGVQTCALPISVLFEPTGNAKAIFRVFEGRSGEVVGIYNCDYGLLEKKDLLSYGEIETDEGEILKYILVYDHSYEIQGFITGSQKF